MKFNNPKIWLPCLIVAHMAVFFASCKEEKKVVTTISPSALHQLNNGLIEISMEDVYNPPIATRIFAYSNMAAFEVNSHKSGKSFMAAHTGDSLFAVPKISCPNYELAALFAFCEVSKSLVFSEYMMDTLYQRLMKK